MKLLIILFTLHSGVCCQAQSASDRDTTRIFDPKQDIISLHYDHAPDKDDGHSAAADRTLLQTLYGQSWLEKHVIPVS